MPVMRQWLSDELLDQAEMVVALVTLSDQANVLRARDAVHISASLYFTLLSGIVPRAANDIWVEELTESKPPLVLNVLMSPWE